MPNSISHLFVLLMLVALIAPTKANAESDKFFSVLAANEGRIDLYGCTINIHTEKTDRKCTSQCTRRVQVYLRARGDEFFFTGTTALVESIGEQSLSKTMVSHRFEPRFTDNIPAIFVQVSTGRDGRLLWIRGREPTLAIGLQRYFDCRGIRPRLLQLIRER